MGMYMQRRGFSVFLVDVSLCFSVILFLINDVEPCFLFFVFFHVLICYSSVFLGEVSVQICFLIFLIEVSFSY